MTPVPKVESLDDLNAQIRQWDIAEDNRRIAGRVRTIGEDFAVEAPLLNPLPTEPFDPGIVLWPRVNKSALITVRSARYSVPVKYIGRKIRVSLRAGHLVAFDGKKEIARHVRVNEKWGQSLVLDHYLEILAVKPGALPGSHVLAAAREQGVFTAEHEAFWTAARKAHGDRDGTGELVKVLLLHRQLADEHVIAGLRASFRAGATTYEVVAVEARAAAGVHQAQIIELRPQQGIGERPLPDVAIYDELLVRRQVR